jgi:hypothetical protein
MSSRFSRAHRFFSTKSAPRVGALVINHRADHVGGHLRVERGRIQLGMSEAYLGYRPSKKSIKRQT